MFSTNEKLAILNILYMIIEADTIIHPKELEYIDSVLIDFAVTPNMIEQMDDIDMQWSIDVIMSMSCKKRAIAKAMFVKMAEIDGFVDPREKVMIEMFK